MMNAVMTAGAIHSLIRCRNLQELLDRAAAYLAGPVILADLSLHVLAITRDDSISDPRWIEINDTMSLPMNILNVSLYQRSMGLGEPVETTDSTGLKIIRCAVTQEDRLMGYLLSPCYYPGEADPAVMSLLADLCSVRMQKDLHYAEYPENMLEFFISDLLNGTITDEQALEDRCRLFRWEIKFPCRVLTVQPESGQTQGEDYLALDLQRSGLQAAFPESTTFLYGDQIKMILPVYDQTTQDTLVLESITAFLKSRGLVAGCSQIAYRLRGLSRRHTQAMKALQAGRLFRGVGPLFRYDTHSVYHCLELCASEINLLQLCHSAVLALEAYDRANNTELLSTLHAYLACHRNSSEAAASLYIHRNTLAKRLEKINDLVSVDFNDTDVVFHLMFSYRILEYYGATVMRDSYENWMEKSPTLRHT